MTCLFHTGSVPQGDRVDYWRSALLQALDADCSVEPARSSAFDASIGVLACGPVDLVPIGGSPYAATRHGPGRDGWVSVMFQFEGLGKVADKQRSAQLTPGDVCIVPPDREIVTLRSTPFQQVLLNARTTDLDQELPRWREATATTLKADRPGVRAAAELVRYIASRRDLLDAECRDHLGATALRLLAGLIGAEPGAQAPAGRSRIGQYHRQRIEGYILENLRDPELSVAVVARELGLSRRYLHKLYLDEGTSVMHWAMRQRLAACKRELAARGTRSVGEVAYGLGFNSLSHFSRAFRKEFGLRPSEV